jgi:hypothetical protein
MNAKSAFFDHGKDFVAPNLARIVVFERATRATAAENNGEYNGVKKISLYVGSKGQLMKTFMS